MMPSMKNCIDALLAHSGQIFSKAYAQGCKDALHTIIDLRMLPHEQIELIKEQIMEQDFKEICNKILFDKKCTFYMDDSFCAQGKCYCSCDGDQTKCAFDD